MIMGLGNPAGFCTQTQPVLGIGWDLTCRPDSGYPAGSPNSGIGLSFWTLSTLWSNNRFSQTL